MYQRRYENRRNQQNEDYERICREYEVREADMVEALKAKDSQLAVLRVRIQEVDSELKNKIQTLAAVESQNEKYDFYKFISHIFLYITSCITLRP